MTGTIVVKAKCMSCQLHFAAYTWQPEWQPEHCPECGSTEPFLTWAEQLPGQIYEYIPGRTPLRSLKGGEAD